MVRTIMRSFDGAFFSGFGRFLYPRSSGLGGGGGGGGGVLSFYCGFAGFFVVATSPELGDSGRGCSFLICRADKPVEVDGCALLSPERLLFLLPLPFCSVVLSLAF